MTKKTDKSTDIVKTKKKETEVPAETKKEKRDIPATKLPKNLKKSYTQKQLEKRFYKRIYIPEDKAFLESFFKEDSKNKKEIQLYSIPKDLLFTKKEISRLSALNSEIKKKRSRVRWIPLLFTILILTAVVFVLSATKNILVKKGIQSICETTFEAKCDIAYLDISFFNSYFKLKGLQIANKAEPMKNLVSVEQINFDFDMLELLKARFVANELSITGVATNTDRTYSGDISAKLKAKAAKKKAKKAEKAAKKSENSEFMKLLTEKKDTALETLKTSVTGLFDQYNPETILNNCYNQLQTPDAAKSAEEEIKSIIAKWAAKPKEVGDNVNKLKASVDELTKLDINAIKSDPAKLKSAIEAINETFTEVNLLKKETENISNELKKSTTSVTNISKKLEASVKHDTNLVGAEISKYSNLNLSEGKRFISGTFDNICYQLLGKYYPTVKKVIDYVATAKDEAKEKKKLIKKPEVQKKEISTPTERAQGRTIYFKQDTTPKFWIKKAAGSGPNFAFDANNITNDMDKTGKPATGNVSLTFQNLTHTAKLSIDTRSESKEPLVIANYNCDNLPLSYPTSKFGDAPGVPGIETTSNLDLLLKFYENDGFDIKGSGKFTNMNITTVPFEPEFASKIYASTLAGIKSMELSATAGYTLSKGLNLQLYSDADKQFINALSKELTAQLSIIKEKAETELVAKLNQLTSGALGEISSFDDIKNKLNGYKDTVDNMSKTLEAKKLEFEKALQNTVKTAVEDTKNKAKEAAKDAATSKLKELLGQ